MAFGDEDLKRLAREYVHRQVAYMGGEPPKEHEIQGAAMKVYRVLRDLARARRAHARAMAKRR